MMKRKLLSVAVVFATAMYLLPVSSFGQEKVFKLRYTNWFPATNKLSLLCEQWCREVEKQTNGRVKIEYFPGGTLVPAALTYDNIVNGIADIGYVVPGFTRGKFPLTEVITLPLGLKSGQDASRLANEFYLKFKPKEYDETKVMYLHAHGPGLLHTKKPVSKLEDIRSMKIRASGTVTKIAQALGASPVGTAMPEVYDALRTGVVDGALAPYNALEGFKWGELIGFSIGARSIAYADVHGVFMNKDKWNELPPDIQKIIEKINFEWLEKQGKLWDEMDREGKVFATKHGDKVVVLSANEDARWKAKMQPLFDDYVKAMKAKGLPGDEALRFCVDYAKKH